jgi:hypothetical protein
MESLPTAANAPLNPRSLPPPRHKYRHSPPVFFILFLEFSQEPAFFGQFHENQHECREKDNSRECSRGIQEEGYCEIKGARAEEHGVSGVFVWSGHDKILRFRAHFNAREFHRAAFSDGKEERIRPEGEHQSDTPQNARRRDPQAGKGNQLHTDQIIEGAG